MILVLHAPLESVSADALAWPTDDMLRPATGAHHRLLDAGGAALLEQLTTLEPLPVGAAVVTSAGQLAVPLLISGVVRTETENANATAIHRTIASVLHRAEAWRIRHLAMAPFGTGVGQLDADDAAAILAEEIRRHQQGARYPERVTIVVHSDDEALTYSRWIPEAE